MEKNNHQGKGFASGFFWGLIIGGGIVALLITKRGREVLRELLDHILSSLEEMVEPKDISEKQEEDFVSEELPMSETEEKPRETNGHGKRLFRGIKKK